MDEAGDFKCLMGSTSSPALSLKKAGFFSFGPESESLACLQFLDAGGNVSGTGTTNALGFGLIGCLAGYAQFPLLHDAPSSLASAGLFLH